jgi:hypothetical protein
MTPDGSLNQLRYGDAVRFTVNAEASEIWIDWDDGQPLESISLYFLNPVLGFCLRLRGMVPLHASVVNIDGGAVVVTAPSGWGKSTLAYRLALLGYPVVTDDIGVVVNSPDGLAILPGYPYLRVWPDAVEEIAGENTALPHMVDTWDKRFFDLQAKPDAFAHHPVPIKAIYYLQGFAPEVRIERVPLSKAIMVLMDNTYMYYLLDAELRKSDFQVIARLASSVPVRHLIRPAGLEHLDETINALLADVAQGN